MFFAISIDRATLERTLRWEYLAALRSEASATTEADILAFVALADDFAVAKASAATFTFTFLAEAFYELWFVGFRINASLFMRR